ncbi:MAG: polysaccharide pyruvyl transferase family protein [Thermoguttaceae bacterium]
MKRRDFLKTSAIAASSLMLLKNKIAAAVEGRQLKTILLISGWQDVNIGDITHTTGLLQVLKTHFPDVRVILWKSSMNDQKSPAVEMIRSYYPDVDIVRGSVNRTDMTLKGDDLLAAVAEADIFLHGSGPSVVRWDALAAWMNTTAKPFGIFGTTIGSVSESLKSVLNKASFIFTRETDSIEVLKKAGFDDERIRFVPDATFGLTTRNDEIGAAFLKERGLESRKFICVVPRLRWTPYSGRLEKEPDKHITNEKFKEIDHAKARSAMISWIEATKLPVLVCPEMTYQIDIMDDLLIDPLPESVKPFVQKREYWMPDEAASIYSHAHTVLSFECHSPIIAMAMGTPAFYLRQPEDTIKGQMYYDLGLNDWVFEIDQVTGEQISARLIDVVTDYPAALKKVENVQKQVSDIYTSAASDIRSRFG